MDSLATNAHLESELIDLGTVPLTVLRKLNTARVRQALRHVVEQTGYRRVAAASESQRLVEARGC